jgi:RNA polymerase sigma factor (sigma-70 family)
VESALELRQGTAQGTGALIGSLLRLRSDEQLVELFRAGNEDAFCAIHDRYRKRLGTYAAQMLNGSGQDAEDALQDVFERAYLGLRAHDRDMALRAWLYRVAHNRCLDQLRRPSLTATVEPDDGESRQLDPVATAEQRETLGRLIIDIGRLPDQQRSALLLRELSGMSYAELAGALAVSVPAVKSLLVRARIGLAAAGEARDTACSVIREELVLAHDRGARPGANVRRHLRDCSQCRHFRRSMRSVSRNLAAVTPVLGPLGLLVKLLGGGGGAAGGGLSGSGGGAAVGGSAVAGGGGLAAAGGAMGTAGVVTGGLTTGTVGHVAAIVAAALMTAGGAVAVQPRAAAGPAHHLLNRPAPVSARPWSPQAPSGVVPATGIPGTSAAAPAPAAVTAAATPGTGTPAARGAGSKAKRPAGSSATSAPSDPASSATGTASASTGSTASGTTDSAGSATSSTDSTSTAGGSSATAAGDSTGTSSQSSNGTAPATSSSGTGSADSTAGSTSDS